MSKKFLHGAQIGSPVEQMGSCCVTQGMGAGRSGSGDLGKQTSDEAIHPAHAQTLALAAKEQCGSPW